MKRIKSNVKGHIDIKPCSPYVLLHGRNGGGKSLLLPGGAHASVPHDSALPPRSA